MPATAHTETHHYVDVTTRQLTHTNNARGLGLRPDICFIVGRRIQQANGMFTAAKYANAIDVDEVKGAHAAQHHCATVTMKVREAAPKRPKAA